MDPLRPTQHLKAQNQSTGRPLTPNPSVSPAVTLVLSAFILTAARSFCFIVKGLATVQLKAKHLYEIPAKEKA